MYITESMKYDKTNDKVTITLIWKTQDNVFNFPPGRYINNARAVALRPEQFAYTRRGEYLVGTSGGSPTLYPNYWAGIGEWRIDPKIRGNVRGCV